MRRPPRVPSGLALLALATALTAGPATADSLPPLSTVVAAHALGAKVPTDRVPPRANGGKMTLATLPVSIDLRKWAVTPGNQGQLNSCVTWAIDYAMLGWYARSTGHAGQPFAPTYTYSQINNGVDNGSQPTDALDVAVTQGSDTRADYTQGDSNWSSQPTAAERASAAYYKIKGYQTLFAGSNQTGATAALKQALAANQPVAIEMAVRNGFDVMGSSASAVDDDITSTVRGYHEVLAVGYDASGLIIQNSWGTGWGNGGFGRLSWRVVQHDLWEADTITGFAPVPALPSTSAPTVSYRAQSSGATPTTSYGISWNGTAGTSGKITRYDAWYQIDGGALVSVKLGSALSTSLSLTTRVGHHYRIAVRATAGSTAGELRYGAEFVA